MLFCGRGYLFFKKIATNIIRCNDAFTIDEMDILYLVKLRLQSAARKKLVATANRREGVYKCAAKAQRDLFGKRRSKQIPHPLDGVL